MAHALRIAISRCLLGEAVRYDGGTRRASWLEDLSDEVLAKFGRPLAWVPVCPEVELGLGVPRPPIHIRQQKGGRRLCVVDSGEDLSEGMDALASRRARGLAADGVVGVILKARSPSCAVTDAPRVDASGHVLGLGPGRFAEALLAGDGFAVVSDEALATEAGRQAFLRAVKTRA